jgi:hypothetical protein
VAPAAVTARALRSWGTRGAVGVPGPRTARLAQDGGEGGPRGGGGEPQLAGSRGEGEEREGKKGVSLLIYFLNA